MAIEADRLLIGPIEVIDGTPVLDIKPVVEEADDFWNSFSRVIEARSAEESLTLKDHAAGLERDSSLAQNNNAIGAR